MDETTTRPATGTDAVALGMEWLDENAPGWRNNVDPRQLDIDDPWSCVLAQVSKGQGWFAESEPEGYGTPYGVGLDRAPIARDEEGHQTYSGRRDWTQDHGFMVNWDAVENGDATWSSGGLMAGWRAALAA